MVREQTLKEEKEKEHMTTLAWERREQIIDLFLQLNYDKEALRLAREYSIKIQANLESKHYPLYANKFLIRVLLKYGKEKAALDCGGSSLQEQ